MRRVMLAIFMSFVLLVSSLVTLPLISESKDIADTFTLKVTPDCGFNMLEWTPLPGASSYWIYRGPGPGQEYPTPLTDFPIPDTKFKDDINIENGKEYCYYLTGVNQKAEEFGRSNEACATPKCSGGEEPVPPEEEDCKLVLKYQIDNKNYFKNSTQLGPMETAPEILFNRMFLLIRYVAQEVGALVEWDAAQKRVIIKTVDGNTIEIWVGKPKAKVNGVEKAIDPNNPKVVGYIKGGRVLMPMRFVAENLGATGPDDIKWFEATKTVELYFGDPECRKCVCLTVAKVDCNAKPPTAYCTDKKGKNWTVYISAEMCKQLKVGGCYSFCGYVRKPNTTPTTATAIQPIYMWASVLKPASCPCPDDAPPETDAKCVCITVEKNECGANGNMVSGVGDDGNIYLLEVTADQCAQMMPGTCWKVCGSIVRRINDKTALMKVLRAEKVDCPCKPRNEIVKEKKDCKCFTVERIDCNAAKPTVYAKDENGTLWQLYMTAEQCRKFVIGKCYKACGMVPVLIRVGSMPYMKVETFEETTCPCKTDDCDWILGEILGFGKVTTGSAVLYTVQFRKCGTQTIINYTIKEDMLDASGRQKISEYKGCAKICLKDGVIIKWERIINVQECCASIDCEWVLGEFTTTWNYQTKTISFKPCGKDVITLKSDTDMQDESKRFPLSQYRGCAKVCIRDGVIIKWIALWDQKPCCPDQVKTCICATIDEVALTAGYIMVTDENGKKWKVLVPTGIIDTMKKGECWKICGQDVTPSAVTFAPMPTLKGETFNKTDCPCKPGGTTDEKCVCLTVQKINCDSNNPTVQGIDENGNQWVFVVSPEICKKLLALFREKGEKLCIKICGVPIPGTNLWKMTRYEMVDCPCATPVEKICRCVKIKRVDCNSEPPKVYGTDENGNDIVLVLTKEQCARYGNYLVPEKCIKVCGVWVKIALGPNIDGLGLKIETIEPVDCERCKPQQEEKCVCLTVMRISCDTDPPTVYGVDENGTPFTFTVPADVCSKLQALFKEKGGKLCIKICGVRVPGTNLWKMTKFEIADCPCKPPEPQIECHCIKIQKVDCDADPPKVYGTDENGNGITLVLEKWMCQSYANFLVPEKCIKVCGVWVTLNTSATAVIKGFKVGTLAPIDCAECKPQQEEKCVCLTVKRINCDSDQPTVLGVDENGIEYTFVISQEYCKKLAELWQKTGGKVCIKICGVRIPGTNLWKMTKLEFVDCPCKPQEPKIDCYCVKILKVDCTSDPPKVYVKDENGNQMTLVLEKWMCERYANFLVPEKCLKVCGTWIKIPVNESTTALGFKVTSVAPIECSECKPVEPKLDCYCVKITKVDCTLDPPRVFGNDENGKPITIYLEKWMCEKYANFLVPERCIKVCGTWVDVPGTSFVGAKALKAQTIDPIDCKECKPQEPVEKCVCLTIQKFNCDSDQPTIYGVDENGVPYAFVVPADYCKRIAELWQKTNGKVCVKICGVKIPGTTLWKMTKLEFVDCPCKTPPTEEKCFCVTIEKVDCEAKPPVAYARDKNNVLWMIQITPEACKLMQPGTCWEICGIPMEQNSRIPSLRLTRFKQTDCPCAKPEGEMGEICVTIVRQNCDFSPPYIVGQDENGDMWQISVSPDLCAKFKIGTCWIMYGRKIIDPNGVVMSLIKVEKYTQTDCPCKKTEELKCMCVEIVRVNCDATPPTVYAKTPEGVMWILQVPMDYCKKMMIGSCWEVCGYEINQTAANAPTMTVKKAREVECPCGEKPVIQCICITVERQDCSSNPPKVYGKEANGRMWVLEVPADLCKKMVPGTCWNVCGPVIASPATNMPTMKVEKFDQVKCPCGSQTPEEPCFCVEVVDAMCTANGGRVYAKDSKGNMWVLLVGPDICEKIKPKTCWKVCGTRTESDNGLPALKVTKIEQTTCPCDGGGQGEPSGKCICFKVVRQVCDTNNPYVVYIDEDGNRGTFYTSSLGGKEMCEKMKVGTCWIKCQYTDASGMVVLTISPDPNCSCKEPQLDCFCVEVIKSDCDPTKAPTIIVKNAKGNIFEVNLPNDLMEYCQKMTVGTCWKICGRMMTMADGVMKFLVTTIEPTNCPCAQENPDCITIKGKTISSSFTNNQWWVRFQTCDGETYSYYSLNDLPDSTGVYPLSQYTGCAKLCITPDGAIASWTALPNEICCPNNMLDCNWKRGKVLNVIIKDNGSFDVEITLCDGSLFVYKISSDMADESGSKYISDYRGCIEVCLSGDYILAWRAIEGECCP